MSIRGLWLIWAVSLGLALCLFAACYRVNPWINETFDLRAGGVPATPGTVVIGTSLTGRGFPPYLSADKSPWRDEGFRWAVPNISFVDTIYVAEQALKHEPDRLLIEAGPLVRRVIHPKANALSKIATRARRGLRALLKLPSSNMRREYDLLMRATYRPLEANEFVVNYRFNDWANEPQLGALLERAEAKGVEIVLFTYPRAESSIKGSYRLANLEDFHAEVGRLAQHFGLAHFKPEQFWPDEFFTDRSHLNHEGRQRYLAELETWWAAK